MFSFALGALGLSLAVTTITYFSTRSSIIGQYVSSAESTAENNASIVHTDLYAGLAGNQVVDNIDAETANSSSLLFSYGAWAQSGRLAIINTALPASLVRLARSGTAGEQIFQPASSSSRFVAVGLPVRAIHGTALYFEVFPLALAARELRFLLAALIFAAVITTIAGAIVGRWAARRALRPLREVSQAALAIAEGLLDTRIETAGESDLAILASSFNRMVDRLQQRIEREARFTSDVSHELRSPLTTLSNSLSVLESRRDELPGRSQQALGLLSDEIHRFQRMVADLLEISRIDAGSADFRPDEVAVTELVWRSLHNAGAQDVPIAVDPAVLHRRLLVDKRRFERIITNLIENARRYAGGATGVVVRLADDDNVQIIVEDSGPGVPPQERERIFGRFARGATAAGSRGTGGGTGLGLALVSEHVKLHRGRIWVEDSAAGGARFIFELPLLAQHGDDADIAEPVSNGDAPLGNEQPSPAIAQQLNLLGAPTDDPGKLEQRDPGTSHPSRS